MTTETALKILVEEIHSAAVATIGEGGRPQIRIIDMMLYDDSAVYFLTAIGKNFYHQLTEQKYIALTAVKGKMSISLRGYVKNIGQEKLDEIFKRNPYMQAIYPENTKKALQVFALYKAQGEYFDISDPSAVKNEKFFIGESQMAEGYYAGNECTGCKLCYSACPQKCIDVTRKPAVIDQAHCLHCGNCADICPVRAIKLKEIMQ